MKHDEDRRYPPIHASAPGGARSKQSHGKAKEIRWITSKLPRDYPDMLPIQQFINKQRLIRTRGVFSTLKPPNRYHAEPNPRGACTLQVKHNPKSSPCTPQPTYRSQQPDKPPPKIQRSTSAVLSSTPLSDHSNVTRAITSLQHPLRYAVTAIQAITNTRLLTYTRSHRPKNPYLIHQPLQHKTAQNNSCLLYYQASHIGFFSFFLKLCESSPKSKEASFHLPKSFTMGDGRTPSWIITTQLTQPLADTHLH